MDSTRHLGVVVVVEAAESLFLWLELGKDLVQEEGKTKSSDVVLGDPWLSTLQASSALLSLPPQRWPASRSDSALDFLNGFGVPYDSVEVSVVRAGGMLDVSLISSVVGDLGKDKFPRKAKDKWN